MGTGAGRGGPGRNDWAQRGACWGSTSSTCTTAGEEMVKASKGIMEKTRQKFRRSPRQRGLSPITRSLATFKVGEHVTIVIDSSVQKGWPHHRFHGMTGTVVERRGAAFVVDVRFGGRVKQAIVRPEHLRRA